MVAIGPPSPEASSRRNAAASGFPNSVLMAAKLPVAAMTAPVLAGTSRLASLTASTASPPPSAISGASGPTTAPSPRPASAARKMPGSSAGCAVPPALKPSAGE